MSKQMLSRTRFSSCDEGDISRPGRHLQEKKMKYILGYDLNDSMSQISYFELNESVPETVAGSEEEERLGIPTVLSKRKGVAQWEFGTAAIKAAEVGTAMKYAFSPIAGKVYTRLRISMNRIAISMKSASGCS